MEEYEQPVGLDACRQEKQDLSWNLSEFKEAMRPYLTKTQGNSNYSLIKCLSL